MTYSEFQRASSNSCLLEKRGWGGGGEEMQRQGRRSQETIVQPWGRVLVPPQELYITISLSCLADTEVPQVGEVNCMLLINT